MHTDNPFPTTMTLRLLIILSFCLLPAGINAQYVEQSLVVYHHNGETQYFDIEQIDSITYSNYDAEGQWCDTVATQQVHTPDTLIRMSIAEVDSMKVLSLPSYCPDSHHPHAIDLGLPGGMKWACCNVGAASPEDFGSYFAWGEVEEKDIYVDYNYVYSRYDKGTSEFEYTDIGTDISQTEYDVAFVKWGEPWRMPSRYDCLDLIYNSENKNVYYRGVKGVVFTGTNGNSVFLPFAGYKVGAYRATSINYWTSSAYTMNSYSNYAYFLSTVILNGSILIGTPYNDKFVGRSIRAVAQ